MVWGCGNLGLGIEVERIGYKVPGSWGRVKVFGLRALGSGWSAYDEDELELLDEDDELLLDELLLELPKQGLLFGV